MSNEERFLRLWVQAQPTVAAYIHSCVPDFHEAEDLLQEVSLALHKKFADYDPSRPFVALALGVARLEILNTRRTHARSLITYQPQLMDQVVEATIDLAAELDTRKHALRQCLQKIEGRPADALRLRYETDLKPDAIAERLGLKPVAARVLLSRAREWLRQCVERTLAVQTSARPAQAAPGGTR